MFGVARASGVLNLDLLLASSIIPGMADKGGAYGAKANDTEFRKKWDKAEYAERAKQKDEEAYELAKENEERAKQGVFQITYPPGYSDRCRQKAAQGQQEGLAKTNRAHEAARGRPRAGQELGQDYGR